MRLFAILMGVGALPLFSADALKDDKDPLKPSLVQSRTPPVVVVTDETDEEYPRTPVHSRAPSPEPKEGKNDRAEDSVLKTTSPKNPRSSL